MHGLAYAIEDAAVATLRWTEASLALGVRDGVAEKCRRLVVVFESQGVERRARMDLAYLQEALQANRATPVRAPAASDTPIPPAVTEYRPGAADSSACVNGRLAAPGSVGSAPVSGRGFAWYGSIRSTRARM